MPVDLDRMFAALRVDADAIALAEPSAPRRRGERRRRNQLATVAFAVVVVLVTVTGGSTWLSRHRALPDPAGPPRRVEVPDRPVDFQPLRQVGPGVDFGAPIEGAISGTLDGVAYLGWRQKDGDVRIAALDTATGQPRWPARTLGRFATWNGIEALPQGLVVIAGQGDAPPTPSTLFVIDPVTGATRWQQNFDANDAELLYFDAAVVLRATWEIRALDWRTGARLWTEPTGTDPPELMVGMRPTDKIGWPGGVATAPVYDGDAVLQLNISGTLVTRDVRTGRVASTRPIVTLDSDESIRTATARDGWLYAATRASSGFRVIAVNLATRDAPRVVYTSAAGREPDRLVVCGSGAAVCVAEETGPETADLVSVDPVAGAVNWRVHLTSREVVAPLGDRVLAAGRHGMSVLGTAGRALVAPGRSARLAGWVAPGSVIAFTSSADGRSAQVFGYSAPGWSSQPLGTVSPTPGAYLCSWDARSLTCPLDQGFRVWRFAA